LFTITSESTRNLRLGAGIFPQEGVILSDIRFLLIPNSIQEQDNLAPIAEATAPKIITHGDLITLDASASDDTDGLLTYQWSQTDDSGLIIQLDDFNTVKPKFITPSIESNKTISFELTVTDNKGLTDKAVIDILAIPNYTKQFQPSSDSNIIYVSSNGNDETAEIISANSVQDPLNPNVNISPFKTLKTAISKLRNGYPDWILLKRGDVWENESFGVIRKSGRNINERIIIAYYGSEGDRPLIKSGSKNGILANNKLTSNIAIIGLDFYAHTRDPSSDDYIPGTKGSTGIALVGGGDNILIENTAVRYFRSGITMQSFDNKTYRNFELKRSIITHSYALSSHSQGMYIDGVDGILIQENLFDHNGWHKTLAPATKFNHNIYMQTNNIGKNIIVRANVITRGSSHGIHGRAGGLFEDNLFAENSISLQLGYFGTPLKENTVAQARNNVILSGKLMDPTGKHSATTKAIWGLYTEVDSLNNGGIVKIENNLIANAKNFNNSNSDIKIIPGAIYSNNITYNWNSINDNYKPEWVKPDINISDYMESIGAKPTIEEYLTQLRSRKLNQWNKALSAPTVNKFIRSGFEK